MKWEQVRTGRNEMEKWNLVGEESGTVFLSIRCPLEGGTSWRLGYKVRRKLKRVYRRYYYRAVFEAYGWL